MTEADGDICGSSRAVVSRRFANGAEAVIALCDEALVVDIGDPSRRVKYRSASGRTRRHHGEDAPRPCLHRRSLPAYTVYIQIFETNILRLLEEHDMTKQELAEKADISISFLSDLTHGKANPSLKIMESIADALDVPLPHLLESTELTFEQLAELRADSAKPKPSVPSGYERVSAILPEFQAFLVKQWAEAARKRLRR